MRVGAMMKMRMVHLGGRRTTYIELLGWKSHWNDLVQKSEGKHTQGPDE